MFAIQRRNTLFVFCFWRWDVPAVSVVQGTEAVLLSEQLAEVTSYIRKHTKPFYL